MPPAALPAPAPIQLSGSIRARAEVVAGQVRPAFRDEESLTSLRTTLRADIGTGPVRLVAELWDSRAYGIADRSAAGTGEVNAVELVQAHVAADLGAALGPDSTLAITAGRMILNLGSRRLVAADDYRNTTNGYTGVRIDAARHDLSATLIWTMPQYRLPDGFADLRRNRVEVDRETLDAVLWGGIFTRRRALADTDIELTLLRFAERDSPALATRDRRLATAALRLFRAPRPGRFDHEFEAAWQWGRTRDGLGPALPLQAVAAGFVHADLGYSWAGGWQPRLSIEFDFASGDRPGGRYTRFDTLFGMRRADFSPSGIFATLARTNIVSPGARLEVAPTAATDAHLSARPLWADSASDIFATSGRRDAAPGAGRFAGYQLDTRLRHWLLPERLRAEANGAVLLNRGVLRGASRPTTIYVAMSLTSWF